MAAATTAAAAAAAATTSASDAPPACTSGNEYNGDLGLRISAVFVILVGSMCGALFPVIARRSRHVHIPAWVFFVTKYFGSGVIIATAFVHLLSPANDALRNPCLTGPITEYDWVSGISLMAIFVLFFIELMAMRYAIFDPTRLGDSDPSAADPFHSHSHSHRTNDVALNSDKLGDSGAEATRSLSRGNQHAHTPGEDHLSHTRRHNDTELAAVGDPAHGNPVNSAETESVSAQLTAIFILEFGVVFHSVFVGLTLAVAGDEFRTLYVVLVFHQTFEGLGLGSRLAVVPWPRRHRVTPYILGITYGLTTPVAIAIGLGLRETWSPGSQTALIVNGVFDSISAGILIYTGLVELMAHEFMFSEVMRKAPLKVVLSAFAIMCLGAGLMALLGKWA